MSSAYPIIAMESVLRVCNISGLYSSSNQDHPTLGLVLLFSKKKTGSFSYY